MNIKKRMGYGLIIALALQAAAPVHAGVWSSITDWFSGFSNQSKNTAYVMSAAIVACCGAFSLWRLLSKKPSQAVPARVLQQDDAPVQQPIQVRESYGAASFLRPDFKPIHQPQQPVTLQSQDLHNSSVSVEVLPGIYDVPMPVIPPVSQAESKRSAAAQLAQNISSAASSTGSALAAGGRVIYSHLPTQEQLQAAGSAALDGAARAGSVVISAAQTAVPVVKDAAVTVGNSVAGAGRALYAHMAPKYEVNRTYEQFNARCESIAKKNAAIQATNAGLIEMHKSSRFDTAKARELADQLSTVNTCQQEVQQLKPLGQSLIRRYEQDYVQLARENGRALMKKIKTAYPNTPDERMQPMTIEELYSLFYLVDGAHFNGQLTWEHIDKALECSVQSAQLKPKARKKMDKFKNYLQGSILDDASAEEFGAFIRDEVLKGQRNFSEVEQLQRFEKPGAEAEVAYIRKSLASIQEIDQAHHTACTHLQAVQSTGDRLVTKHSKQKSRTLRLIDDEDMPLRSGRDEFKSREPVESKRSVARETVVLVRSSSLD